MSLLRRSFLEHPHARGLLTTREMHELLEGWKASEYPRTPSGLLTYAAATMPDYGVEMLKRSIERMTDVPDPEPRSIPYTSTVEHRVEALRMAAGAHLTPLGDPEQMLATLQELGWDLVRRPE